jgi:neurofibromin 1
MAFAMAYHWRVVSLEGSSELDRSEYQEPFYLNANYFKEPSVVYGGPLNNLHALKPLHDVRVLRILHSISYFTRYQLADTDWEHFPFNWNKSTGYPTSVLDQHQHFFKTVFAYQSNYTIANQILTFSENLSELEADCKRAAFQIVFFLSETNWPVLMKQFQNCIIDWQQHQDKSNSNSDLNLDSPGGTFDLRHLIGLQHAQMNRTKLKSVLLCIGDSLSGLQELSKGILAVLLRNLLLNWIQNFPYEYREYHVNSQNVLDRSEIFLDWFTDSVEGSHKKKCIYWPTILLFFVISCNEAAEYTRKATSIFARRGKSPYPILFEGIKKALKTKSFELGVYCCGILTHFAVAVESAKDNFLRTIFYSFEEEVKDKIWDASKPVIMYKEDEGYLNDRFMVEFMCHYSQLKSGDKIAPLFIQFFEPNVPIQYKSCLVSSIRQAIEMNHSSLRNNPLDIQLCRELKSLFTVVLKKEKFIEKPTKRNFGSFSMHIEKEKPSKRAANEDLERSLILQNILTIWNSYPLSSFQDIGPDMEELRQFLKECFSVLNEPSEVIRTAGLHYLVRLMDPLIVSDWNGSAGVENEKSLLFFWKTSSLLLRLVARQILSLSVPDASKGGSNSQELASLCLHVLHARNLFIKKHVELAKKGAHLPERFATSVTLEISLILLLNSPDIDLSRLAVECIDQAVEEVNLVDVVQNQKVISPFFENIAVYKEIGSQFHPQYWNQTISPKVHSKAIRKLMRMFHTPTPGLMGSWEEIYRRWKIHYAAMVNPNGLSSAGSSMTSLNEIKDEEDQSSPFKRMGMLSQTKAMKVVLESKPKDLSFQEFFNYTGSLFALANMCIVAKELASAESGELLKSKSQGSLFDLSSPRSEQSTEISVSWVNSMTEQLRSSYVHSQSVVERFLGELIDLMVSENVTARESIKELIGYEVGGKLAVLLFERFEAELSRLFDNNSPICSENNIIYVEGVLTLCHIIVTRAEDLYFDPLQMDDVDRVSKFSINVSGLIVNIMRFIQGSPITSVSELSERLRLRLSGLITLLLTNRDRVGISGETEWKVFVLETLVEWSSVFSLKPNEKLRIEDRKSMELDQAVMKAITLLTKNLLLKPVTHQNGNLIVQKDDDSALRSKLFLKFFRFFLKALEAFRSDPHDGLEVAALNDLNKSKPGIRHIAMLKNLAISSLSNLISSNMDIGIKNTLSIAYDSDPMLQGIAVQVITTVLKRSSNNPFWGDIRVGADGYSELLDKLLEEPYLVLQGLAEICSLNDIEELIHVYLDLLGQAGKSVEATIFFAKVEINNTDDPSLIFRRNSLASRLISAIVRMSTKDFVKHTLGQVFQQLLTNNQSVSYEVDPSRVGEGESLETNLKNLEELFHMFFNSIIKSIDQFPVLVSYLCAQIAGLVEQRFPGCQRLAIGGIVFLRLCCPIILSPDSYAVVHHPIADKKLRRGLLLVSKIIQNLANNVVFGSKESYLISFNDLLKSKRVDLDTFLDGIVTMDVSSFEEIVLDQEPLARGRLHKILANSFEKIEKLTNSVNANGTLVVSHFLPPETLTTVGGYERAVDKELVRSWEVAVRAVGDILNQLGPAPDIEVLTKQALHQKARRESKPIVAIESISSHAYTEILQFVRKNRLMYVSRESKGGRPIVYYISRLVKTSAIDSTAILFCLLSELRPYLQNPIDVVVDLTMFSSENDWSSEMMSAFEKLIPLDQKTYLHTLLFINPNTEFKKIAKRCLKLISPRQPQQLECISDLEQLTEFIDVENIDLPQQTRSVLTGNGPHFDHVLQTVARKKEPVKLTLLPELLLIQSQRKQDILGTLATIVDVLPYDFITDVTTTDEESKKSTDFFINLIPELRDEYSFSTLQKDTIIQSLHSMVMRARLSNIQVSSDERVIGPKDLPGTLLNIALTNLCSAYGALRSAGYNLVGAIQASKNSGVPVGTPPVIPSNNQSFVIATSKSFAISEKGLTYEFLNEWLTSYPKFSTRLKYLSLSYVIPWVENLSDGEVMGLDKCHLLLKKLLDTLVAVSVESEDQMSFLVHSDIWRVLGNQKNLHLVLISILVEKCVQYPLHSNYVEFLASVFISLAENSSFVTGFISYVKEIFENAQKERTPKLYDCTNWKSIAVSIRFLAQISFGDLLDLEGSFPDILYFAIQTIGVGSPMKRRSAHVLIQNCIHSLIRKYHSGPSSILYSSLVKLANEKFHYLTGMEIAVGSETTEDFDLANFPLNPSDGDMYPDHRFEDVSFDDIESYVAIIWNVVQFGSPNEGNCDSNRSD